MDNVMELVDGLDDAVHAACSGLADAAAAACSGLQESIPTDADER